jgi:hypothetical protein
MLGTLIKALEVDLRNADNERYVRSEVNISQNLARILAIRKHYPEFKVQKALMYPKLAELCKVSKKEGLCLSYWHDGGVISEFKTAIGSKTEFAENAVLAMRPSRFKTASLSRFMQRGEDQVLMHYLTDLSQSSRAGSQKRVLNTQAHRQQVTGLLYQLHMLEEQLHSMIEKHSPRIDFTPYQNVVVSNQVFPISFDNAAAKSEPSSQSFAPKQIVPFDTTGPIDIWYSLAEDPRTPYRFLVWLSENHNPYVSQRALTTLKKQQNESRATVPVCYSVTKTPSPLTAQSAAFAS